MHISYLFSVVSVASGKCCLARIRSLSRHLAVVCVCDTCRRLQPLQEGIHPLLSFGMCFKQNVEGGFTLTYRPSLRHALQVERGKCATSERPTDFHLWPVLHLRRVNICLVPSHGSPGFVFFPVSPPLLLHSLPSRPVSSLLPSLFPPPFRSRVV